MSDSNFQIQLTSRKPRLLKDNQVNASNYYSQEEDTVYSTRSSVDKNRKSERLKPEFTFREQENPQKVLICPDCVLLKSALKDQKKSNVVEKSKLADSEKYLKQLKSLLDIKSNRLKEEESVLKAEKDAFNMQKTEFSNYIDKKKEQIKQKLQQISNQKKLTEKKNKELEGLIFEYKNNKKILKSSIKAKISEKFSLREAIILKSQEELQAKEENFRVKCWEKEKSFKEIEEDLMEKQNNARVVENCLSERQSCLVEQEECLVKRKAESDLEGKQRSEYEEMVKVSKEKEERIQELLGIVKDKERDLVDLRRDCEEKSKKLKEFEENYTKNLKNFNNFEEVNKESQSKLIELDKLVKELQRRLGIVSKREEVLREIEERCGTMEKCLENEKKEVDNKMRLVRELERELEDKKGALGAEVLRVQQSEFRLQEVIEETNKKRELVLEKEACLEAVTKKLLQKNLMLNYKREMLYKIHSQ